MHIGENKQYRLSLSVEAYDIIKNDCMEFGRVKNSKPQLGGFINDIFINFHTDALSNIQQSIETKSAELISDGNKQDNIDIYIEFYKKEVLKKIKGLLDKKKVKTEYSMIISMRNDLLDIINNDTDKYKRDIYNDNPSLYIRAVIEEYCELKLLKRKEIYFKKIIEELEPLMKNYTITIKTASNQMFKIKPVLIQADTYGMHFYLAGISADTSNIGQPVSYRIDHIHDIKEKKFTKCSKEDIQKIENAINEKGIQYLSSQNNTDIKKIRLTESGQQKYNKWLFQRPLYSSIEGKEKDIFVFDVPDYQIQVYFFKFGADAEILEPEELRVSFAKQYAEAANIYNTSINVNTPYTD